MGRLSRILDRVTRRNRPTETTEPVTGNLFAFGSPAEDDTTATVGLATFRKYAREDCEVRSAIGQLIDSVISLPWSVTPSAPDDETAKKQAAFVENNIRLVGYQSPRTWQTTGSMLSEILWHAVIEGLTIGEPVWMMSADRVWLDTVAMRSRDDYSIMVGVDGYPVQIDLPGRGDLDIGRLIIAPFESVNQEVLGTPVMVAIQKWVALKELCRKAVGIYAERAAGGIILGKYPPGTSKADQTLLLNYLKRLNAETTSILPSTATIEHLKADTGPSDIYSQIIEMSDRQIRKLILWAVLSTDFAGSAGSRASSEVTGGIQARRVTALARWLEHVVNRGLVQRICDYNWDTSTDSWDYPEYVIDTSEPVDRSAMADIVVKVSGIGGRFAPEWLERTLGIDLENDEPIGGTAEPAPTASFAEPSPGLSKDRERQLVTDSQLSLSREVDGLSAALLPYLRTLPAEYAKRADEFRPAIDWLNYHRDELNGLAGTQNASASTLLALARERGMNVPDMPRIEPPPSVRGEWRDSAIRAMRAGVQTVADRDRERARNYAETWDLPDFVPGNVIDQFAGLALDRYPLSIQAGADLFLDTLADGLRNGWTADQIADDYGRKLGVNPSTPDKPESNYWMRREVATAMTEAMMRARHSAIMGASWAAGYMYSAILDDRTTPICRSLDGKIFSKDDKGALKLWPPNHYHCRSDVIPLFSDEIAGAVDSSTVELKPDKGFRQPITSRDPEGMVQGGLL